MGRSQVEYNRSHRNRGSKGRGGRGGTGRGRGGRGGGADRKTTAKDQQQQKHIPLGDNAFRYEQDPYSNDANDDDNIMEGMIDLNAYGPSHDAITLKSEQRVVDDDDNYNVDAPEKASGGIYNAGGELSSALSKLPASVWMRLPAHIGERIDISMGKSTIQTKKKSKKKIVQRPVPVGNEETKVDDPVPDSEDENKLAKAVEEKCHVSEKVKDQETDKVESSNIVTNAENKNNETQKEKKEVSSEEDEDEGGEEDLDAWLDSVIA